MFYISFLFHSSTLLPRHVLFCFFCFFELLYDYSHALSTVQIQFFLLSSPTTMKSSHSIPPSCHPKRTSFRHEMLHLHSTRWHIANASLVHSYYIAIVLQSCCCFKFLALFASLLASSQGTFLVTTKKRRGMKSVRR
jgi:hypothetical protein